MTVMEREEYYRMYRLAPRLWWYQSLRRLLGDIFRLFLFPRAKILDCGCGTGENIELLQKEYQLTGVDVSKTAITLAKKRGVKNIFYGSMTMLPFRAKEFDAVYSTDVIGMLSEKEQKQAIDECYRVLKKHGLLVVQSAALSQLWSRHDKVVKLKHRFSTQELHQLFTSDRWNLLILSYRFFLLFPIIGGVKVLKKMLPFQEGHSDVFQLPGWLNDLFFCVQSIEDQLLVRSRLSFPFGSSVIVVARKI